MSQARLDPVVWLALGSNLGDRRANLDGALLCLKALPGFALMASSDWIETRAVGGPEGQRNYLNGVLQARTSLSALELLEEMQRIEVVFGRERGVYHGPRTLDLDLLFYGDQRISSERLQVPHPELEERSFVLEPLAQLAPEMRLSTCGLSVRQRLDQLRAIKADLEPQIHGH